MTGIRRSFRFTCTPEEIPIAEELLRLQGFLFEPDPFLDPARRLLSGPFPLGNSVAATFGLIYIQDRASMLPPLALRPPQGASVLDMCSSPGSKLGELAWLVGKSGMVLGNEPSPARLANLRRNLMILGLLQAVTSCQNGEHLPLPDSSWGWILLDPPCSGWGTLEKNPRVMEIWKGDKVEPLIRLQKKLLCEAERLLRPGGVVVYSTCTTNSAENEAQVLFARKELGLNMEALECMPGFDFEEARGCEGAWRLSPKPGDTQGFFVARLRKQGTPSDSLPFTSNPVRTEVVTDARLREQGIDPAQIHGAVGIFGGNLHALPPQALALLPEALHWQGLYIGKLGKNGDVRLSPRLRLEGSGICVDLEHTEGIQRIISLLQGQSLPLPSGTPAEARTALLRWNGLPLCRLKIKKKRLLWSER